MKNAVSGVTIITRMGNCIIAVTVCIIYHDICICINCIIAFSRIYCCIISAVKNIIVAGSSVDFITRIIVINYVNNFTTVINNKIFCTSVRIIYIENYPSIIRNHKFHTSTINIYNDESITASYTAYTVERRT